MNVCCNGDNVLFLARFLIVCILVFFAWMVNIRHVRMVCLLIIIVQVLYISCLQLIWVLVNLQFSCRVSVSVLRGG